MESTLFIYVLLIKLVQLIELFHSVSLFGFTYSIICIICRIDYDYSLIPVPSELH